MKKLIQNKILGLVYAHLVPTLKKEGKQYAKNVYLMEYVQGGIFQFIQMKNIGEKIKNHKILFTVIKTQMLALVMISVKQVT